MRTPRPDRFGERRGFLAAFGTVLAGVAGCLGEPDEEAGDQPDDSIVGDDEDGPDAGDGEDEDGEDGNGLQDDEDGNGDDEDDDGNGDGENGTDTDEGEDADDEIDVSFEYDDRTVEATLFGDGECGVVFAHGVGFDRHDWAPQARSIAEEGHLAFTVDLDMDDRESNAPDLVAAIAHLEDERGVETVVLIGSSAGANAVLRAHSLTEPGSIDGTVALAPGQDAEYADELEGRFLALVAEDDGERFVETTEDAYDRAPEAKEYVTVVGNVDDVIQFEGAAGTTSFRR